MSFSVQCVCRGIACFPIKLHMFTLVNEAAIVIPSPAPAGTAGQFHETNPRLQSKALHLGT
ncbi:hypothetical protein [Hydrocarboniphaga sp.]|uniref:hypothetical protein n=1 Tax=Hydrocarboniphaga sp. TaxID=2033016 RepID=UPI00261AD2E8|nr:hypothetical protein [Hydrocarboniphaga sp.]